MKITTSTSEPLTLAGDGVSSTDGALNLPTSSVTASGTISLSANTTIKVESGITSVTLSGVISGSGTLTKTGAGALTLSGTNTYTGTTAVNDGDLNLSNNAGLGASGATQGTTVASGASLKVGSLVTDSAEPLTISGTGYSSYGALFFNGGGKFSGTVALSGDTTIRVASGTTGEISGVISGSSVLTKSDLGTLTLSGANTYTGATTVSAGSIAVSNASSLGT
ncbi:MAG: hypothetical protein EBT21_06630, partial [Actinobacteria bacterium]|nr:hypothetical protein [Actinomycetota bacterium]